MIHSTPTKRRRTRKQIKSDRLWKHWLYWLGDGPFFNSKLETLIDYNPDLYRAAFERYQSHGKRALTAEELEGIQPLLNGQKSKEILLTSLAIESMEFWAEGCGWIHPWRHTLESPGDRPMDRLTKVAILRCIRSLKEDSIGFFIRHPGIESHRKERYLAIRLNATESLTQTAIKEP